MKRYLKSPIVAGIISTVMGGLILALLPQPRELLLSGDLSILYNAVPVPLWLLILAISSIIIIAVALAFIHMRLQRNYNELRARIHHAQGRDLYENGTAYQERGDTTTASGFFVMAANSYINAARYYIKTGNNGTGLYRVVRDLAVQFLPKTSYRVLCDARDNTWENLIKLSEELKQHIDHNSSASINDEAGKLNNAILALKEENTPI